MNNIFVFSYSLERLNLFQKYYNVLNEETNTSISLILDDRKKPRDYYDMSKITFHENVYWATDIIEFCRDIVKDQILYDKINAIYGPAIKLLTFHWIYHKLNIVKAMILDDDVFFLRPIDDLFNYDYVIKEEHMSRPKGNFLIALREIYPDRADALKNNLLNSGTIIYTYRNDLKLYEDISLFYNPLFLKFFENVESQRISKERVKGRAWILEQYAYGLHFMKVKEKYTVNSFKEKVRLITTNPSDKYPKSINKLPNIMHFLPIDKDSCMSYYSKLVDDYLIKNGVK